MKSDKENNKLAKGFIKALEIGTAAMGVHDDVHRIEQVRQETEAMAQQETVVENTKPQKSEKELAFEKQEFSDSISGFVNDEMQKERDAKAEKESLSKSQISEVPLIDDEDIDEDENPIENKKKDLEELPEIPDDGNDEQEDHTDEPTGKSTEIPEDVESKSDKDIKSDNVEREGNVVSNDYDSSEKTDSDTSDHSGNDDDRGSY